MSGICEKCGRVESEHYLPMACPQFVVIGDCSGCGGSDRLLRWIDDELPLVCEECEKAMAVTRRISCERG